MKVFSLYKVELRRMFLSKMVWLAAACCLLAPLLGNISEVFNGGMAYIYIAIPVLIGTSVGAIVWAAVVILETSRMHRGHTDVLTDAAASSRVLSVARMLAAMTLTAAVTALCAFVYLPYTAAKMEYLFHTAFYFANFFVFMMPTWWISAFFAEGLYQITRRVELAVILYALLAYCSLRQYAADDYFMRWLNPKVITYSDGFMSWWPLRMGLYTRLLWLCISIGLWVFSLLCVRKYEKNLPLSFLRGVRKLYLPVLAVLFGALGAGLWAFQPFIDHGPAEITDEDSYIDTPVTKADAIRYTLFAKPFTGQMFGRAEYDIQKPYTGEDKLMINPGYKIRRMVYGGKEVAFRTVVDDLNGVRSTYYTLPDIKNATLVIEYGGLPTQRKSHAAYNVSNSVDKDYISLGMTSIVPLLNCVCEEEGGISFEITIPDTLTPYLNSEPLAEGADNKNGTKTWHSRDGEDLSYFFDFTAGNYITENFTAAGVEIAFVYGKAYEEPVREYGARQSVIDVFEYCTKHYGALAMAEGKAMALQQVSSMLMGGHAYGGYSEWFETVLSPLTLADADKGANATEVFIHEMIHQWWGAYGLDCDWADGVWSEEDLTVYATYRLVKEKYGTLYAKQYYTDVWEQAVQEQDRSFYNRYPEYLDRLPEKYRAELDAKNSATNRYMRMPLMLLKAEQLVGGEGKMDEILSRMYADRESYRETYFTYEDFLDYCGLKKEELVLDENIEKGGTGTW